MKKYFLYCLFVPFVHYRVTAQSLENTIGMYGNNFPNEKIHLQFDKQVYLPGETIWFKAYLFQENLPSNISTNFYAALYDEDGKLLQKLLCPIINSTTDGHFDLPDSLSCKQLICKAYTTWMLNSDTTFLFTKAIKLITSTNKTSIAGLSKTVSLQFFPEGGDLIAAEKNTLAFKATFNNGLPFTINGVIKTQSDEDLLHFSSMHDGMGRFDIDIPANEKLYAEWMNEKGEIQKTFLPKAKPLGVCLKMIQQKNKLIFNIVNKLSNDSLHVLMYMYQKVFYKINLAVPASSPYTGIVPVNTLPTGIAQVTIFDNNWQPVAERVVFINNGQHTFNATINSTAANFQKKGKNQVEIDVADTIPANMSLSITDADFNNEAYNNTIVTDLLLSGDVKGYIYQPAYYFTNNDDDGIKANLDLVMLTNGWRRYNWDSLLTGKMPQLNYEVDNFLTIKGQVDKKVMDKINKDEKVNLVVKTKDSTSNFYLVKPDSTGLIWQAGLAFYDTAKVLFSFNKNKNWNPGISLNTSNFTYIQPVTINTYPPYSITNPVEQTLVDTASLAGYFKLKDNNRQFNKDKTLQTVTVKSSGGRSGKNDPLTKLNERYTDGLFRGTNGYSLDVMHDEMASAKQDVYNYMVGKVPGLSIDFSGGGKAFVPGDAKTPGIVKAISLYINGRKVENEEVASLNIDDIAYIKYLERYGGEPGFPPALSFYLKKGDDLVDRRPKDTDLKFVKVPGYTPIKEFYSPDYSQADTYAAADTRTTLLWVPYIITNASSRKIPITFYNNDFSKKLLIVLEGINEEGKMIHIEKRLQ